VTSFADKLLCGWRVASELPLPDLLPWAGDARPPDVTIDLGAVPRLVGSLRVDGPFLQIADDGTCRYEVTGIAAYGIRGGREIVVDAACAPDASDVRVFLFGSVLGILCHQRGVLPLHASVVAVGDLAIAFPGGSGRGKSTLAAAFMRAGHQVLCDDIAAIDRANGAQPHVLPSFPRLKLWSSALAGTGVSPEHLERSRAELEKFHLPVERAFRAEPLPLVALYYLGSLGSSRDIRVTPLAGLAAVAQMHDAVYRPRAAAYLGAGEAVFARAAAIAAAVPEHYVLERPSGLAGLPDLVTTLAARHEPPR
jgi:hypothetical protein